MSRAALAKKIGLTRAAITKIVDSLINEGIIVEKGTVSAGLGRNPTILDINPDCYYAIGLNLTRNKFSLGAINAAGEVIKYLDLDIDVSEGPSKILSVINGEVENLLASLEIPEERLLGLGIIAPGPLDSTEGIIINPPNFTKWENVPIVAELKKTFEFPVILENNASAFAIAEKNYGAAKSFSDFILLNVDAGIGAGIITNNTLYKGANSLGAELGHTSIIYDGKKCSCGNNGCLEVYASVPAIVEKAKQIDAAVSTWEEIVERALTDERFVRIVEAEADYLATSIVTSVNILGIEAVILSGEVTYRSELLLKAISKRVNSLSINRDLYKTNILISDIKSHSEIVSAASIVFEKLF